MNELFGGILANRQILPLGTDAITNVVATLARAWFEVIITRALASVATCELDGYSFANAYSSYNIAPLNPPVFLAARLPFDP